MFNVCLYSILEKKNVSERYRINKQSKNLSPQLLYLCAQPCDSSVGRMPLTFP